MAQAETTTHLETISEKFVRSVERQFTAQMGQAILWTPLQKTLAQHLYIKIDASLKDLQSKGKNVHWNNINRDKLALDAVLVVSLELDGLIPNHLNVVPYKNGALSKGKDIVYDLAIRPGYVGKLLAYRKASLDPIVDIDIQLVFKGDTFVPKLTPAGDSFEFTQIDPFRSDTDVVGGFGFIRYEDSRKNKLVIVTQRDFERSRAASKAKGTKQTDEETGEVSIVGNFWEAHPVEMREKTVCHRTAEAIVLDPAKVNTVSFEWASKERDLALAEAEAEAEEFANRTVIDIKAIDTDAGQQAVPQAENTAEPAHVNMANEEPY